VQSQAFSQARTDAAHPLQSFYRAEGPKTVAVRNDSRGHHRPDPGKELHVLSASPVNVEWARQPGCRLLNRRWCLSRRTRPAPRCCARSSCRAGSRTLNTSRFDASDLRGESSACVVAGSWGLMRADETDRSAERNQRGQKQQRFALGAGHSLRVRLRGAYSEALPREHNRNGGRRHQVGLPGSK
jgi:hypothetical protein